MNDRLSDVDEEFGKIYLKPNISSQSKRASSNYVDLQRQGLKKKIEDFDSEEQEEQRIHLAFIFASPIVI